MTSDVFSKITIGAMCQECNKPVAALAHTTEPMSSTNLRSICDNLPTAQTNVAAVGVTIAVVFPTPPEPRVPTHLPPSTEVAFLQAERAFARGDADAAGMMYRRALETALKLTFPQVSGSLYARINALVTSHDLPPAIGAWAHEVRDIGNDAAHDTDALSEEDMVATRNFVDAVLRYVISLPKEIELRRAETSPPEPPAD